MIAELDIWRAALLMTQCFRRGAADQAMSLFAASFEGEKGDASAGGTAGPRPSRPIVVNSGATTPTFAA
jgi:hypothetical protein